MVFGSPFLRLLHEEFIDPSRQDLVLDFYVPFNLVSEGFIDFENWGVNRLSLYQQFDFFFGLSQLNALNVLILFLLFRTHHEISNKTLKLIHNINSIMAQNRLFIQLSACIKIQFIGKYSQYPVKKATFISITSIQENTRNSIFFCFSGKTEYTKTEETRIREKKYVTSSIESRLASKGSDFMILKVDQEQNLKPIIRMHCNTTFQLKLEEGIEAQLHRRKAVARQTLIRLPQNCQAPVEKINNEVYNRFQVFTIVQSFKSIKQMFLNLYGRHSAIIYKNNFNFKEQWEDGSGSLSDDSQKGKIGYALYASLVVLLTSVVLWGLTICLIFAQENRSWVFSLAIFLNIVEIVRFVRNSRLKNLPFVKMLLGTYKQLLCIGFSILSVGIEESRSLSIFQKLFTIAAVVYFHKKLSKRYQELKIFHLPSVHQDAVNLIDLFVFLISISHIFAIALIGISEANQESNWMHKVEGLNHEDWLTKYVYSFYFACTTMLTVGYGDLSPTNVKQILVILAIQIIGIATFAYTVNQIGVVIANMQSRKEKMEKGLNCIQNIGNAYHLEPEIVCKMRSELINNMEISRNLKLDEQNKLLVSFSDTLRNCNLFLKAEIQTESGLKILKRSLFVIANWTGKMQFKIAQKLVKEIYSPEEYLLMPEGKEKLFIIDEGKVDILNDRRIDFKICFQKVLKTIEVTKDQEVAIQNVFGYSSIISNRKIHLNARCKEISICYTLKKEQFKNILSDCTEDLQYFHELKNKIQLAHIPQEIEAPSIVSIREHYHPVKSFIVAKHKNWQNKLVNQRKDCRRQGSRRKLNLKETIQNSMLLDAMLENEWLLSLNSDAAPEKDVVYIEQNVNDFESVKDYERYFSKRNHSNIIRRLKSRNYMSKTTVKN